MLLAYFRTGYWWSCWLGFLVFLPRLDVSLKVSFGMMVNYTQTNSDRMATMLLPLQHVGGMWPSSMMWQSVHTSCCGA